MKKAKGPKFIRFFVPTIDVLKELGGSGTASEVIDRVIEKLQIPEQEQQETIKSGASRVRNQVQWARLYLVRTGYLDSSKRGVWSLTEKGLKSETVEMDIMRIFKSAQKLFSEERNRKEQEKADIGETGTGEEEIETDYKAELLDILKNLPPNGFERICQRLLRESGFQQVTVTGKSGDGGIDGNGVLELNPFVSFNVLFQCKRYQGAVSASQIRDFRGAMMGRADKGIIITTGTFTIEVKKEARRDGVPPIELVDGEKLVDMFEHLELGLVSRNTYDIDSSF
ncbi:restriction endonuclease, partial [bacterium]|nr:restriction endonuclease [bacterium]